MRWSRWIVWGVMLCLGLQGCSDLPEDGSTEKLDEAQIALANEKKAIKLWKHLSKYRSSYLTRWEPVFKSGKHTACDVIDAFNDVAWQMTGPDGVWRTTAPDEWLECADKMDDPLCDSLNNHLGKFLEWDDFQESITRLEPGRAAPFFVENHDKFYEYLDLYVLKTPSPEAMRRTKFYRFVLAGGEGK
jgi:hypothetical protein